MRRLLERLWNWRRERHYLLAERAEHRAFRHRKIGPAYNLPGMSALGEIVKDSVLPMIEENMYRNMLLYGRAGAPPGGHFLGMKEILDDGIDTHVQRSPDIGAAGSDDRDHLGRDA